MEILKTGWKLGRTIKNMNRLGTIVAVFGKHGFHNLAERIKLGQFILNRFFLSNLEEKFTTAERIRMSFEELGPTFVKLGQLLATRPDLVPQDYVDEFSRLHDQVQPLSFEAVEMVLKEEFGSALYDIFESIDPKPLGSASIAQVHRALIKNGNSVVIKIQRPKVKELIKEDIQVLYFLSELIEKYVPESKSLNLPDIVDEYCKTLELELNFVVEANNIRRFTVNFENDKNIHIPKVFYEWTTERVLTMEALDGVPLTSPLALQQEGISSDEIIRIGLKTYMKMVFTDGLFHGDLHAGNFFLLPNNKIGLIDFGVVGRLNKKTQSSITNMLIALSKEDYEQFANEYIMMAPFNENVNVDLFARDLQNLIAPYFGLTLKNVNLGKILMSSASIAAKHQLKVPTELMLYFKSIVSIEGLAKKIKSDFDFLGYSLEFAAEIIKNQYDSSRIMEETFIALKESKNFLIQLPKQMHYLVRKVNSPNHRTKIQLQFNDEFKKIIEPSAHLIFLGMIISSLLLGASWIATVPSSSATMIAGIPALSVIGYSISIIITLIAFVKYFLRQ